MNQQITDREALSLYRAAVRNAWLVEDVEESIIGQATADSKPGQPPLDEEAIPFAGFPSYQQLDEPARSGLARNYLLCILSDIHFGEEGAMTLSAQILAATKTRENRLALAAQVFEEARHVDFFRSLFLSMRSAPVPVSPSLECLISNAAGSDSLTEKLLVCQLIVENLAIIRFRQLLQHSHIDILRQGLHKILQDEARHASLGPLLLRQQLNKESSERRKEYCRFVTDAISSIVTDHSHCFRVTEHLGWEKNRLRMHLRHYHLRQERAGSELARRMSRAMRQAGLITVA